MTRTYAKNQGQMPRGSKISVEKKELNEQRDGRVQPNLLRFSLTRPPVNLLQTKGHARLTCFTEASAPSRKTDDGAVRRACVVAVHVVTWPAVDAAANAVVVGITDHPNSVLQPHACVRTVVANLRPVRMRLHDLGNHVTDHHPPRTVCTRCTRQS